MRAPAIALAILLPATAHAADLAYKALPPPPPVVCVWCGFYLGINGGYGWGNGNVVASGLDLNTQNIFKAATFAGIPLGLNDSLSGGEAGAQFGYNLVFGPLVLGAVADAQWADISGRNNGLFKINNFSTLTDQVRQRIDGFGTVRGTLGCACGTWEPYVTAGAVVADVDTTGNASITTSRVANLTAAPSTLAFNAQTNSDQLRGGWVWGGGVKWQPLPFWSVGIEYLNLNLGTVHQLMTPAGLDIDVASRFNSINVVRLEVDYHFPVTHP